MRFPTFFISVVALLVAVIPGPSCDAAVTLYDFESPLKGWSCRKGGSLSLSGEYPVNGSRGVKFTHPQWRREEYSGQWIWPAFENWSVRRDWSGYDRLVVHVYNASDAAMQFNLLITDSRVPFQQGARFFNVLEPHSARQLVLHFGDVFRKKKINPADVAVLHFYSENPASDLTFFVDDILLLAPGEEVPPLPEAYIARIRRRQLARIAPLCRRIASEASELSTEGIPEPVARCLTARRDACLAVIQGKSDVPSAGLTVQWESVKALYKVAREFTRSKETPVMTAGFEDLLPGYATSMEKILPFAAVFDVLPSHVVLEAARGEKEAFQLIVMPTGGNRKAAGVKFSSFMGEAGTLPPGVVTAVPVGFVETGFIPKSGSDYVGFYSDPLLSFLDRVELRDGAAQPFWICAAIPENQPAGTYRGEVEMEIDGTTAFRFELVVRVHDFTLPKESPLPLAVTFSPVQEFLERCNPEATPEQRNSPDFPVRAWRRHKKEWVRMLSEYFITYDSLYEYGSGQPDFAILTELAERGRLGFFNLGGFCLASDQPARQYNMQDTIERLRPRYEKARELGLLEHAYLYGCDEALPETFPQAERAAALLKKEFPGVPIFTTATDKSYGLDGRLGSFDWFCPLTAAYDPEQARQARQAGKKVWWYICNHPTKPHANVFLESPAIEIRVLMGAMTARYRPDGFLYYQTSLWNSTDPIASGPFTTWIAESYPQYNGDGSWTYPGPDSTPLASIRLENFRDGLEDYAYVKLLEQRLEAVRGTGRDSQWQKRADAALAVPTVLVSSLSEFSRDPRQLQQWRKTLADLIESAPLEVK